MSSEIDPIDDAYADKAGLILPHRWLYEQPEMVMVPAADSELQGLTSPEQLQFDKAKHRADLEMWVVRGAVFCLGLVIVLSFLVLEFGSTTSHAEVAEMSAIYEGPILAALGYAFGRHKRQN
jgi:hypothetical protein